MKLMPAVTLVRKCFYYDQKLCAEISCLAICYQPVKPGPCRGSFRRWFYNQDSRKCEAFVYGGCQGNGNNFESEDKCEDACEV